MKIPAVKGTRDFYPADMAVRNRIIDGWKRASLRNGFAEYDGPIFEYLKMYQLKSGDEIAEQLFSLKDRGGRDLAIRPEITPTLARMVNQRINSLPKPVKWFSVPRLCRAERPQKGRFREFFQWNIDIIGIDDVLADAEVIFTTVDYLRDVGLTSNDVKVKISSRKLLGAVLSNIGIPRSRLDSIYALLDKKTRLPAETFNAVLAEQVPDEDQAEKVRAFMELKNVSEIKHLAPYETGSDVDDAINEMTECIRLLDIMDVGDYCVFAPSIVHGLAYYTGIVFEVHDAAGRLRAIGGGGRFDNLLHDFGGPRIPATGMGMGDCVLEILLKEKGLLDESVLRRELDFFVIVPGVGTSNDKAGLVEPTRQDEAVRLTARLRSLGFSAEFSYKSASLGRQLKEASNRNAKTCIIIGDELSKGELVIKDMATGEQELVKLDEFLKRLQDYTPPD